MEQKEQGLPTRLAFPVIIESIFEIRFAPQQGVADLLPGILLTSFPEKPRVERLPLADVPHQVRLMQPELAGQPVVRLVWDTHSIFIGDGVLGIGCAIPYPGWNKFKAIINTLMKSKTIHETLPTPDRFSVKYVDFFRDSKFPGITNKLKLDIKIADENLIESPITLRTERKMDDYICLMEVHSHAHVSFTGPEESPPETGTIISFDLIKESKDNQGWGSFLDVFDSSLEYLHNEGKNKFFGYLSPEVLKILAPTYD
ncbi:TIGR04255 family protein [Comamonas sp. CMM03]|uniref:TIGR04255 family protein n=1 Tax=Comamonas sp. CMM03 TaxID=2854781 RepID=UPI001C494F38|nr:TIGR04255 family protein [Comamonas sp. CMM03]MBV7418433.1 TIGR04255 family protein [Comamonas sp. CMM03]